MAGWSFTASGLAKDAGVIRRIGDEVSQILAVPEAGKDSSVITATHNGWGVEASGDAEEPRVHTWLVNELKKVLDQHDTETGHSTFTSPFLTTANFHTPAPPAGAAPPAAGPAVTPAQQGAGGAAASG